LLGVLNRPAAGALGHELVELGLVLGVAKTLQEGLELVRLLLKPPQGLLAIVVEGAIAAGVTASTGGSVDEVLAAAQEARVVLNGEGGDHAAAQKVVDEIKAKGGEAVPSYDSVSTPQGGARFSAAAACPAKTRITAMGSHGFTRRKLYQVGPSRKARNGGCSRGPWHEGP